MTCLFKYHIRQRAYWLILILAIILTYKSGIAREAAGLYRVTIPVTGQSEAERATAFSSALNELIIRVSGRKTKPPTVRAEDLVAQYSYEMASGTPRLVIDFDPAAINRLLTKRKIPVWGEEHRPAILMWLVVNSDDGAIRLAGSDGPSPYQEPIQQAAQRRGITLVWPIMDLLEDAQQPLPEDKERLVAILHKASRGYPVETVWIGRLDTSQEQTTWKLSWTLIRGNAEEHGQTSGETSAKALGIGMDQLAERLAISSSKGRPVVKLVVAGVTSLASYAQVRAFLEGLPAVAKSWPTHLDPEGRLSFAIEPRGNTNDLTAALNRGTLLMGDESPIDLSTLGDSTLYYHLSPSSPK